MYFKDSQVNMLAPCAHLHCDLKNTRYVFQTGMLYKFFLLNTWDEVHQYMEEMKMPASM